MTIQKSKNQTEKYIVCGELLEIFFINLSMHKKCGEL